MKFLFEKNTNDLGFEVGNIDDIEQSKLLNGFCEGIYCIKDRAKYEQQILAIARKLKPKTKYILKDIVNCLNELEKYG